MTAKAIVAELKKLGTEQTKKKWLKHGAQEPCFGVKVEDMKKIQKRVKMNYQLALDLYDIGIADAMYLAGLIADDAKMTKKDLQKSPASSASIFPNGGRGRFLRARTDGFLKHRDGCRKTRVRLIDRAGFSDKDTAIS